MAIVAHLDYSWRIIMKMKSKKEEGKSFLIYHLEINQAIKKIQFQSNSKSRSIGVIIEVEVFDENYEIMKQNFSAMRFSIFPRHVEKRKVSKVS